MRLAAGAAPPKPKSHRLREAPVLINDPGRIARPAAIETNHFAGRHFFCTC
jgi:hypothetical protein